MNSLLCDTVLEYTVNGRVAQRIGNRHSVYAPHRVYPCVGDDNWISIAVTNDAEWAALCSVIDRPDLVADPRFQSGDGRHRNQDSIDPIIEEWTIRLQRDQAMDCLQAVGVPAGAVLDQDEALASPQAKSRGFLTTLTHPDGVQHPYINTPAQFSRTPAGVRVQGPLLGEHYSYILGELLGSPREEQERLETSGVTATLSTDLSRQRVVGP